MPMTTLGSRAGLTCSTTYTRSSRRECRTLSPPAIEHAAAVDIGTVSLLLAAGYDRIWRADRPCRLYGARGGGPAAVGQRARIQGWSSIFAACARAARRAARDLPRLAVWWRARGD